MRVAAAAVVALTLTVVPLVAEAEVPSPFMDGKELKEGLEAADSSWSSLLSDRTLDSGFALGFVVGVADVLNEEAFCLPAGVSRRRLAGIVLEYLREKPQDLDGRASHLAIAALHGAFPCKP